MKHGLIASLLVMLLASCGAGESTKKTERTYIPFIPHEKQKILLVCSDKVAKKYSDTVELHLEKAFGLEVEQVKSAALPKTLLSQVNKDRYRADSILRYMRRTYSGKALKVIMLTHHDISTTKYSDFKHKVIKKPAYRYKDWAIFGLGSCPGECCVVSVKRLWARRGGEKTFLNRLKNISVHEVGHTYGLPHCAELRCVMNDANETILTVDRSTGLFCEKCRSALFL